MTRAPTRTPHPWMIRTVLGALAALTVLAAVPRRAHADCKEDQEDAQSSKKKNYKTIIGPDGRKTFVIEKAFVVCGKVPKPTVIYAFQASTINYEWQTLKQDFLPKVLDALEKDPF